MRAEATVTSISSLRPSARADATSAALVFPTPTVEDESGTFAPNGTELALARELANGTINADLYVRVIGIVPDERRPAKVLTAYLAGVR